MVTIVPTFLCPASTGHGQIPVYHTTTSPPNQTYRHYQPTSPNRKLRYIIAPPPRPSQVCPKRLERKDRKEESVVWCCSWNGIREDEKDGVQQGEKTRGAG